MIHGNEWKATPDMHTADIVQESRSSRDRTPILITPQVPNSKVTRPTAPPPIQDYLPASSPPFEALEALVLEVSMANILQRTTARGSCGCVGQELYKEYLNTRRICWW
jgi:hypothetical protein